MGRIVGYFPPLPTEKTPVAENNEKIDEKTQAAKKNDKKE